MLPLTQLSRNSIRCGGKPFGCSPVTDSIKILTGRVRRKEKCSHLETCYLPTISEANIPWQLIWFNKLQQLIRRSNKLPSPMKWFDWNDVFSQLCPFKRSESRSVVSDFCDPMDCSPPGSSVHGILLARILEWVAITFFRGSSRPRDGTWVSCILTGRFFTVWAIKEAWHLKVGLHYFPLDPGHSIVCPQLCYWRELRAYLPFQSLTSFKGRVKQLKIWLPN